MARGYPDYEGDKQKVYLTPEWAALEAIDKNFIAADLHVAPGESAQIRYTVPAGKTFYLCQLSFFAMAEDTNDSELNQMCSLQVYSVTFDTYYWFEGANGGGNCIFSKPITIGSGEEIRIWCVNESGHYDYAYVAAQGYEI